MYVSLCVRVARLYAGMYKCMYFFVDICVYVSRHVCDTHILSLRTISSTTLSVVDYIESNDWMNHELE
jgi:hypothetical protein